MFIFSLPFNSLFLINWDSMFQLINIYLDVSFLWFSDKSHENSTPFSAAKGFFGVSGCFFALKAQKTTAHSSKFLGGAAAIS